MDGDVGWVDGAAALGDLSGIKRGMISQSEYDTFIDGLEHLAERQRFFYAITMFSYVGVKVAGGG